MGLDIIFFHVESSGYEISLCLAAFHLLWSLGQGCLIKTLEFIMTFILDVIIRGTPFDPQHV